MYACKALAWLWQFGPRLPFWWCVPTYRQSRAAQRAVWEIGFRAGILAQCPQPPFDRNPPRPAVLINGASMEFRTWDDPRNLMGDPISGAVIDEGGLLYPEAHAAISTRRSFTLGPLWWIGNPGLVSGPFRSAASRAEVNGSLYKWTWRMLHEHYLEVGQPGRAAQYAKFIEGERESLPDFEFRRLYEAEWTSDEAAIFRHWHETGTPALEVPENGGSYIHGLDTGQLVDPLAITTIDVNTREIVRVETWRGVPYPQSAERIEAHARLWGGPIVVETNGPGIALYQELQRRSVPCIPFTTTGPSKQDIVQGLATQLSRDDDPIRIRRIPRLLHELSVFRYSRLASGGYRYSAPAGEHDDTVMATAFAAWGLARRVDLDLFGWM